MAYQNWSYPSDSHHLAYSIRRAGEVVLEHADAELDGHVSSRDARRSETPAAQLCRRGNRRATSSATGVAPRDPRSQEVGALSYLKHLECFRCGRTYPPGQVLHGLPACNELASNLFCVYDYDAIARAWSPSQAGGRSASLWRYREFMPVDEESIVTLGEGMTPLLHLPRLGKRLGLDRLYLKDESQNPTWSFKDRMGSVGASRALELVARC